MLREIQTVRQIPGELRRRWFTSGTMDLVVWCDAGNSPAGLQFCYDKGRAERALTWKSESGFSHMAIDDGEGSAGLRYKATPVLMADGSFDTNRVIDLFIAHSQYVPTQIVDFVSAKMREYRPQAKHSSDQRFERDAAQPLNVSR